MSSSTADFAYSGGRTRLETLLLAFCLSLAPGVAIGFGRFGYALVLPAIRTDLGWTYGQSGALNTANALGYLLGAALTAPTLKRVANRPLLLLGLCLSIIALFLASATRFFLFYWRAGRWLVFPLPLLSLRPRDWQRVSGAMIRRVLLRWGLRLVAPESARYLLVL